MVKNILVILLFFPVSLFSKEKCEFQFRKLTDIGSEVTSFIQDDKGYMWIGSLLGLHCHDGYRDIVHKDIPGIGGSSNNRILCLEKDSCGNLWIGKDFDNLCIFNPSTQRFVNISYKSHGKELKPFNVSVLKAINNNEVWAGTWSGEVYRIKYHIARDTVYCVSSRINIIPDRPCSLWGVSAIVLFDREVLIGSWGSLVRVNSKEVDHPVVGNVLETLPVSCAFRDSKNDLWIGGSFGVKRLRFLQDTRQFVRSTPKFFDSFKSTVLSMAQDADQNIYFATDVDGLFVYAADEHSKDVQLARYDKQNSTLFSNKLKALYIDRSNTLWVGTKNDEVFVADLSQKKFYTQRFDAQNYPIGREYITTVFEDSKKRLWIGTDEYGLFCCDKLSGKTVHKARNKFRNYANARILKIMEDHEGNVWFGSLSGLYYLPHDVAFTAKTVFSEIKDKEVRSWRVNAITQDEYGRFWVGSSENLVKLKLDLKNNLVLSKTHYPGGETIHDQPGSYIMDLAQTEKNAIWEATIRGGLCRITYNNRNDTITVERYSPEGRNGMYISHNTVGCVLSLNDSIWVGTDYGLNLYVRNTKNKFVYKKTWYMSDGLPSNEIGDMINDKKGNLWLYTGKGLSKFQTDRRTFVNFNYPAGLQNNALTRSVDDFASETIYFATIEGLKYFHPDEIVPGGIFPRTVITNLLIYNKEALIGKRINGQVILNKAVSYTSEVFLSHKNNNFTLQFSALNFALPQHNTYFYMLEGYDEKWMKTYNHQNSVSYSNLPAGKYVFKVMAANSDGMFDLHPAILSIVIGTPPWRSGWAYLVYSLLLAGIALIVIRYYRNKIRLENEVLLEKRQREQEHELSEMKSNFYTTISHELRTPLTLISAPLSEINEGKVDKTRLSELLRLMSFNTEKLLKLVNQLLDFGKIGQELPPLKVSKTPVVRFLSDVCRSFEPLAKQKRITLAFSSEAEEFMGLMDTDVVDKIVSNLIFNAIKYTPENGSVTVLFSLFRYEQGPFYHIEVADTGIGIEPEKHRQIFEKYYQRQYGQGYGIGLSVVKKLVLLHGGTIDVKSEPGKGTIFWVDIPAFDAAYIHPEQSEEASVNERDNMDTSTSQATKETWKWSKNKEVILVVEDNEDLRRFLCSNLSRMFQVHSASNGKEGLQKAIEHLPDLIVSDIMMPEMDGVALSTAIKSDMRTNHIPFIFLTAKGGVQNMEKGLAAGAEDYLVKPFDMSVLQRKIRNMLTLIEAQREKQRKLFLFEPTGNIQTSEEDEFLKKAIRIIRENRTDPNFSTIKLSNELAISNGYLFRRFKQMNLSPTEFIHSIRAQCADESDVDVPTHPERDVFIREATNVVHKNMSNQGFDPIQFGVSMNLSYQQLHRKLKGSINMTPRDFIRSIRMKKAAEMLKSGKYRVSEVMFEVGFEDPSYFAKMFRLQFGKTPTGYQETMAFPDKTADPSCD